MVVPAIATLREATPDDRETIFRLHMDSVGALCGTHYSAEELANWFVGRTAEAYLPALRKGAVWIAEVSGEPAGFTEVFPGKVTMLFVAGVWAGRGVGVQLLSLALDKAADGSGVTRLESTLNAEAFYARRGFVKVGEGCLTRAEGRVLRTILMERRAP